ncbi:MAG: hypothetical protein E7011_04200 [Alphaproteobacteria bacterium]|nr:hypothetical protein [Alphaproteobacteria bacterium]
MVRQNKQTLEYIYRTLKPLVDSAAAKLQARIEAGKQAKQEQGILYRQISDLQLYIMNNRYDRESVRDAERDIQDYEHQSQGIMNKINHASAAVQQMSYVSEFYKRYNQIVVGPELESLRAERDSISDKMDKLSELIFACDVNMDASERSPDIVAQSAHDLLQYEQEYAELAGRLAQVSSEIKKRGSK